jgi:Ca-activated chloride channel family protein
MIDDDLKKLGSLQVPASRDVAKESAMNAAMDAFDAAQLEKKSTATQGIEGATRPTSIANTIWSGLMNSILKPVWEMKPAAMAAVAGVMLVPVVGVIALDNYETASPEIAGLEQDKAASSEELLIAKPKTVAKSKKAAATAKQPLAESFAASGQNTAADVSADGAAVQVEGRTTRKRAVGSQRVTPAPVLKGSRIAVEPMPVPVAPTIDNEQFPEFKDSGVKAVATAPVSTFSIDVDTASYSRVRRSIMDGVLPPTDMVRVEELINYFPYSYPLPETKAQPFKPSVTIMPTPWNEHTKLMHIGIKGFDVDTAEQPPANLVFLLDVSGSMSAPDKLPLLIKSFRLLLQKLNPTDKVSIVTYAGRSATVLEPTEASNRTAIISALENLKAGGSTAGAQGIEQAYRLAEENFVKDGVNRVMLATDGDFNVGISDPNQLKDFIAKKRKSGVYLSVFGFGKGNINDTLMQSLAQNGNGQAAYIDTLAEAQKALVDESGGTLFPIAKDVKIQVEFDPSKIAEYRLIGYETRALKREDFNNDKVDAGDIGAGHSVTAIYELTPVGSPAVLVDPLRYGDAKPAAAENPYGEIGFLKMRYKLPTENKSKLLSTPLLMNSPDEKQDTVSQDVSFATAVAAFGQKLRANPALDDMTYAQIADMAHKAKGEDTFGYRSAFVQLVRMAGSLSRSR